MNRPRVLVPASLSLALAACRGIEPELRDLMEQTEAAAGVQRWHLGPPVEVAATGPARFVSKLHAGFQPERAMELVRFIDGFYRAPANHGYDEVLARLDQELRAAGFGGPDQRLEVGFLKVADVEAWTPVSGKLTLLVDGEEPLVLHGFDEPADVDRVMLPVNAPSCDLKAEVALHLDDIKKGMVLVTNVRSDQVRARAKDRGAVAVISSYLQPFNEDPSGAGRHLDAIQFRTYPPGETLPTAQISPRRFEDIEAAVERATKRGAKVRLHLQAEVVTETRSLRTLMAVVHGATRPNEAVAMVSHVQEPGANDNATGVAGLLEGARSLAEALRANELPWPGRTLVFLWGDEFRQSESWLDSTKLTPIAGISSDMTGQSREKTGAIALLERNYDPGALKVLGPDFHTPWGAGQVEPEEIVPNGLAVIARCAMADVSLLEGGTWETAEHPWEGGSDHDKFIDRGVPAVLFWHFTDFAYHTSLDRLGFVDPGEMRRTGVALLATGLALASAEPGDLDRYVRTLERERQLRVGKAEGDAALAAHWEEWCNGVRGWLRELCLGVAEPLPDAKKEKQ
jgi:hypothetical protein